MMPKATQLQEKPCFTPGPWQQDGSRIYGPGIQRKLILQVHYSGRGYQEEDTANEKILLATPDLYEAARLLEEAELANANCPDCDGDGVPECCETCFPLFDEARLKRRAALEKAGYPVYQTEGRHA